MAIRSNRLRKEASSWGHSYAATLKEDGYIVGLTSKYPIEVVERLLADMHHGLLHCRTAGIDCFVVPSFAISLSSSTTRGEIDLRSRKQGDC